ncbi:hypothetical protein KUH03_30245 [Sphingobacterium sp. E70]|nr:hypothetical protein KUH03_30245 [Sphingobacterium sp. E70]
MKGTLASDMVSAKLHITAVGKELDPLDWKNYHKLDQQEFMLQNAEFHVAGPNIKQARITGGPVQTDYLVLSDIVKPLQQKADLISKQMMENAAAGHSEANKELGPKYSNMAKAIEDAELKFLDTHPNSFASLLIVSNQMGLKIQSLKSVSIS